MMQAVQQTTAPTAFEHVASSPSLKTNKQKLDSVESRIAKWQFTGLINAWLDLIIEMRTVELTEYILTRV